MKGNMRGINYDTTNDAEFWFGGVIFPSETYETLRQTPEGRFYIYTRIPQIYEDGKWRRLHDECEWWNYVDDQNEEPWDRVRHLEEIRPLSRDEAFRWCIEHLLPRYFALA
jgi:hypothetical protein